MSTIVNNPNGRDTDSGSGFVVGVIVAILLLILFFVFGLPALRGNNADVNRDYTDTPQPTTQQQPTQPDNTTNNFNSTTTINVIATSTDNE